MRQTLVDCIHINIEERAYTSLKGASNYSPTSVSLVRTQRRTFRGLERVPVIGPPTDKGQSLLDSKKRSTVNTSNVSAIAVTMTRKWLKLMPEGTGIGATMHSICQMVSHRYLQGLLPWKQINSHQNANCKTNKNDL